MKKTLLLLSVAALASVANAQVIVGMVESIDDFKTLGFQYTEGDDGKITSNKTQMGPLTILDNDAATFGLAYEDKWGTTGTSKNYKNVKVNGVAIKLGDGAVGSTNPVFTSYESGVMSGGAVFEFEAKKDGFLTVFTSMNPNKQYVVFEGTKSGLPYTLGFSTGTETIHYSLPMVTDENANDYGLINFDAPDADKYFIAATQQVTKDGVKGWKNKTNPDDIVYADAKPSDDYEPLTEVIPGATKPAMPWNVAGMEKAPGSSTGFVTFQVMAGNKYYYSALGSKIPVGGFVFTEEDATVEYEAVLNEDGSEKLPAIKFEPMLGISGSAVEAVEAVDNADAPVYNMMGIRVNSDAKGILIQNGKKFIRK